MNPDPRMRERLSELAQSESAALDDLARARVRQRVTERVNRRQPVLRVGALLAVAAALALFLWPRPSQPRPLTATAPATSLANGDSKAKTEAEPSAVAGCGAVTDAPWNRAGNEQRLDLGERGLLIADTKARVHTLELASCSTRVELEAGTLWVHARDLKGGALSVNTSLGLVEVKGTVFRVRASASELRVTVKEGKVWVTPLKGRVVSLVAGQELSLRSDQSSKLAPSRPQPVVPAEMQGEKVWHSGSVSPSPEPFEPGSSVTEDGRPMQKPRVIEGEAAP